MNISLTDLYYFVEIAQALSLSRAALRLGVTQPTLSVALSRIEHSLGTRLFLRSKKGVLLTPAGRSFVLQSRQLIQNWEAVKNQTQAVHSEVKGRYIIGAHPSVTLYSLPQIFSQLLADNSELEIKLVHDLSRKILDEVVLGNIDIGLVVNPVRHPDLIIKKLSDDQVTLWTAPKGKVNTDVLIGDPELIQTQTLLKKIRKTKYDFKRFISSSNLEVVAALTRERSGIGILPKRVALCTGGLEMIKNSPSFNDEIGLVYRAEMRNVKAVQVIGSALEKALA
ncbi:MAG: LysR family transcriptional regulator [Bdellovibrionota bacterium]